MENTEMQKMLDALRKEFEEREKIQIDLLRKEFEEREKLIINRQTEIANEWAWFLNVKTETVAKEVAQHIEQEVVISYTKKFGADSAATKHAKDIPYQEKAQFIFNNFAERQEISWDEFNRMGGLTTEQAMAKMQEPQVKVQSQAKVQPQAQAEVQSQEQAEVQLQAQAEVQPQAQAEVQPQAQAEVQPQAQAEVQPQAQVKVQPQAQAEVQPQAQVKVQSQAEVLPQAQAEVQSQAQVFTKDKSKAVIQSFRAATNKTDVQTLKEAAILQFRSDSVRAMKMHESKSVVAIKEPEKEQSEKVQSRLKSNDKFIEDVQKAPFGNVLSYRTISPTDERLSFSTLTDEMSTENKKSVFGNSKVLTNYFDKVRSFEFGGKTAEEHREKAIGKSDLKEWMNSFQPSLKLMNENHVSELKLMPFKSTEKEIEQMSLKHKLEKKFFEIAEKLELSKASKYFINELPKNLPKVAPPTTKEINDLKNTFKDYASHRLDKNWKAVYADESQDPYNEKRIKKENLVMAMIKSRNAERETQSINIVKQLKPNSSKQVLNKIKEIRQ